MADRPTSPDSESHVSDDAGSTGGMPRWVKAFGIVAIVLVVLLAGIHLAGGGLGGHMHTP